MFLAHHVYVLSQLEVFVNFILLKNVAKLKKYVNKRVFNI